MAIILNIDTATSNGSVCLAKDGKPLRLYPFGPQKDQAATLAVFIQQLAEEYQLNNNTLQAIAISGGPGSYTGLRVATATAKGLCYAWQIPLIAVNTLQMMAHGMKNEIQSATTALQPGCLLCPMIDARRDEVFTAIYDQDMKIILAPQASIITGKTFENYLADNNICFFGNGSDKLKPLLKNNLRALFHPYQVSAAHLCPLAENAFKEKDFQNLAYFEPYYLKPFFQPPGRHKH